MSVITLAAAAVLSAAQPPAVPASQPAAPGYDSQVRQIVERALAAYASAQSYEDTVVASVDLEFDGRSPFVAPDTRQVSLAFARPGRLDLRTGIYHILSDGKRIREAVDLWLQYIEHNALDPLLVSNLSVSEFGFFDDVGHPLTKVFLRTDKPSLDFLGDVKQWGPVRAEPLDGRPGRRILGKTQLPKVRMEAAFELWLEDKTGLIGEIVYDQTSGIQAALARQRLKLKKYRQRFHFGQVKINQPLKDDRFALKPEPDLEKVVVLKMPSGVEMQQRIVGRPSPDFTGTDLEGKAISSSDLRGRVVLLDFWRITCPPCMMSMPILQKLADKYAGKPVSVIGVNIDPPDWSASVATVVKERSIKFRQIMTTKPSISDKYFISSIPVTVLIDAKGTIQLVHLGPADEKQLSEKIDKLLDGGNLYVKK